MKSFLVFLVSTVLALLLFPVVMGMYMASFYIAIFAFLIGGLVLWLTNRRP